MIWIAELCTRHFTFTTIGHSADEAIETMRAGWEAYVNHCISHQGLRGRPIFLWAWDDLRGDVNCYPIEKGQILMDREPLGVS
tara:strand:- start:1347 stop:1595 length:249 start_codon:yes stop_codon:yes gene_type:complete